MLFTKEKKPPVKPEGHGASNRESLEQFKQRKQSEDVANYLNTEEDWKKEYEEEYSPKTPVKSKDHKSEEKEASTPKDYLKERKEWEKFYQTHFKDKVDLSQVKIPQKPKGNNWRLIFIKKGLTIEATFQKCKKLFNAWKYTNEPLDEVVTQNTRTPTQHYAIWVKDGQEPDEEYQNQSTQEADPDMKIGITLLERLILEIKYYEENKEKRENKEKHLDIKGLTYCAGSRDAYGGVPGVYGGGGDSKLRVGWCNLDYSFPECGLRVAVSF